VTEKRTRFAGIAKNRLTSVLEVEPKEVREAPPAKTGRPPGKKSDPSYTQVTVYLRKDVHHRARKLLFDDRRQFSDLVNELVSEWLKTQTSNTSDF